MRTQPEWPEPGQSDIVWKFEQPVTLYEFTIFGVTVTEHLERRGLALRFGPYAQHKRNVSISTYTGSMNREWPEQAWMVLVRGLHPLPRKKCIEQSYGVTINSGDEPVLQTIEDFEAWLIGKRLEILVDLRAASIAEGWRPEYGSGVPPLHLAHWFPERTVLTCSPSREEWTENRLCHYMAWGDNDGMGYRYAPVSKKVSDYVSPAELGALIASLQNQYRELGRQGKEIRKQHPERFRQKGETATAFAHRYYALPEQERWEYVDDHSGTRQQIFQAIKILKADAIPRYGHEGGYLPEIEKLEALRDAAQEKREAELRAKAAIDFPVDDAAWELEVEYRKAKEAERQEELREFRKGKKLLAETAGA